MEMSGQMLHNQACVVNVGPYEQFVEQTYGRFHIKPCPPELPYTVLIIRPHKERYDIGDERKATEWWDPIAIANDIVNSNGLARCGIFVCKGARPTQHEVSAAKQKLEDWYLALIKEGDAFWAADRNLRTNGINDNHRRAVAYFGETREWAYVPTKLEACPFCQEMIRPASTICKHCGAVIDLDRAVAAGHITVQQADQLRKARAKVKAREDAEHKRQIEGKTHYTEAVVGEEETEIAGQTGDQEPEQVPAPIRERRERQTRDAGEPIRGTLGGASVSVGMGPEDDPLAEEGQEGSEYEPQNASGGTGTVVKKLPKGG